MESNFWSEKKVRADGTIHNPRLSLSGGWNPEDDPDDYNRPRSPQVYTLKLTLYTLHPKPYTLHPTPQTQTLNP